MDQYVADIVIYVKIRQEIKSVYEDFMKILQKSYVEMIILNIYDHILRCNDRKFLDHITWSISMTYFHSIRLNH